MHTLTADQRQQLAACGQLLTELAGLERKKATGFANPCEERRAAELADDARSAVQACAEILTGGSSRRKDGKP